MQTDAVLMSKMSALKHAVGAKSKGPGSKQLEGCPPFEQSTTYLLAVDAIKETNNIYTYDGVLENVDGSSAGFISVGCTKSTFLTEVFESSAGVCTFELLIEQEDGLCIGTVTAEGAAQYDADGIYTLATITAGGGCVIGNAGNIDVEAERVIVNIT